MSPREVIWRAGWQLRRVGQRPSRALQRPRWDEAGWRALLNELADSNREVLVADAERVAAGELDLWGRAIRSEGPPEWHRDPLDGTPWDGRWRRGRRDSKPILEIHRQQHLFPLAAGAALAERDDWVELCARQIRDWISCNPPGSMPGWQSGYETAHRLVAWAWAVPLIADRLSPMDLNLIGDSYAAQAAFVSAHPSRYSSANNHRLAELTALLTASLLGVSSRPWGELWRELEQETALQTYTDGGSREQASGYFLYVLEILWVAALLARTSGRTLGLLDERLHAMLDWLQAVRDEQREPPPTGDDAEDRLFRSDYFSPRRAATIAGRVEALLAGRPSLVAASSPPPTVESITLDESGYMIFRARSFGAQIRVVVDVGELGFGKLAAHGHADALAVLVDVGGKPLLRDSGTGAYAPADVRERHRSTSAHNTVVVDGRSQATARGPHLWGRRFKTTIEAQSLGAELDYVRASHDGYRPISHARCVAFVKPDRVIVLDRVMGRREVDAELVWQLAPGTLPDRVTVASEPPASRSEEDGPFSPRYTWCMEAPRFTWSARAREIVFATVIDLSGVPARPKLQHGDVTTLELPGLRLVERWRGGPAEIER
jgi:hypothetical protein